MSQFIKSEIQKNWLIKKWEPIHESKVCDLNQSYLSILFRVWLQLPIDPCQNLNLSRQCQQFFVFSLNHSCGPGFSISSDPIRI
jgi:hypothetical protein